jgi:hypothetical protein
MAYRSSRFYWHLERKTLRGWKEVRYGRFHWVGPALTTTDKLRVLGEKKTPPTLFSPRSWNSTDNKFLEIEFVNSPAAWMEALLQRLQSFAMEETWGDRAILSLYAICMRPGPTVMR